MTRFAGHDARRPGATVALRARRGLVGQWRVGRGLWHLTSGTVIDAVLVAFAEQFNSSRELPAMTAGWDRTILVRAREAGWTRALRVEGGRLRLAASEETPESADIVLEGASDTLAAIFRGELSPTEPFLDGSLLVRSTEEDMLKLDVFTIMVWGD